MKFTANAIMCANLEDTSALNEVTKDEKPPVIYIFPHKIILKKRGGLSIQYCPSNLTMNRTEKF